MQTVKICNLQTNLKKDGSFSSVLLYFDVSLLLLSLQEFEIRENLPIESNSVRSKNNIGQRTYST